MRVDVKIFIYSIGTKYLVLLAKNSLQSIKEINPTKTSKYKEMDTLMYRIYLKKHIEPIHITKLCK